MYQISHGTGIPWSQSYRVIAYCIMGAIPNACNLVKLRGRGNAEALQDGFSAHESSCAGIYIAKNSCMNELAIAGNE